MMINYKLCVFGLLIITILTVAINYYKSPWRVGLSIEFARKRVNEILTDTTNRSWNTGYGEKRLLVTTKETAISIVEPILFDLYGRKQILSERPYGVYKIGDYWFVSGSLPRYYDFGGGFEIIIDSRDAQVISVRHYK